MIVKLLELAGILGLTERQVDKLAAKGIVKRVKRGKFELAASVQGYIGYIKDGDADKKTTLHDQEIKLKKAQTRKIELDIAKAEGSLIPEEIFQKFMERMITAARTQLLLIENEIPRIRGAKDSAEAKRIYRTSAYAVLAQLAQAEIIPADEEENEGGSEAVEPTAGVDNKRVGRAKYVAKSGRFK